MSRFDANPIDWMLRIQEAAEQQDEAQMFAEDALDAGDLDAASRYAERVDALEKEIAHARKMFALQQRRYQEKLSGKRAAAKHVPIPPEEEEEEYGEWEFGFEYESENGPSSNIDVNFRVFREDRRPFTASEAQRVMDEVRRNRGHAPQGYVVTAIDWKRVNSLWRSTTSGRSQVWEVQDALASVLDSIADAPGLWRLGSIKE